MTENDRTNTIAYGRIDIHSHLLPGIDDGCQTLEESLQCIERLKQAGFVGSFCTPHIWPRQFSLNTPEHVRGWVEQFRKDLAEHGVDYHIWPGGELRLSEDIIDWVKTYGVPTMGDTRVVLVDIWDQQQPGWLLPTIEWLIQEGYQPVFAHPERTTWSSGLDAFLKQLLKMRVWLQGNLKTLTGEDGYYPDQYVRQLLHGRRYQFMALDMHEFASLESRLDGMQLLASEFGEQALDYLTIHSPRKLLLGLNE